MIKNIRTEIDGFTYNIVQMSGEQAFKMQLKLVNTLSGFDMDSMGEKSEMELLVILVKGLLSAVKPEVVLPIVKELLATCGLVEVNKSTAEAEGYNPDRHLMNKVVLDNFYGKDMVHLYKILFAILKANYEDFFQPGKKMARFQPTRGQTSKQPGATVSLELAVWRLIGAKELGCTLEKLQSVYNYTDFLDMHEYLNYREYLEEQAIIKAKQESTA